MLIILSIITATLLISLIGCIILYIDELKIRLIMKIIITGITQLKQSNIILIHGIKYNTKNGPEGISFQASYTDYPYLYSCMETTTPIYVEKFKLINSSEHE